MNKEFVTYEIALALKELGFDENCLSYYISECYYNSKKEKKYRKGILYHGHFNKKSLSDFDDNKTIQVIAPLYQQAFRFFREVKLIECFIKSKYVQRENVGFYFGIDDYEKRDYYSNTYFSYEEAELECLKKLIEIVKK